MRAGAAAYHEPGQAPSFRTGYAIGDASERPDLWRHCTSAWAPFLGRVGNQRSLMFGRAVLPNQGAPYQSYGVHSGSPGNSIWGTSFDATVDGEPIGLGISTVNKLFPLLNEWTYTFGGRFLATPNNFFVFGAAFEFAIFFRGSTTEIEVWTNGGSVLTFNYSGISVLQEHVYTFSNGAAGCLLYVDGELVASTGQQTHASTSSAFTIGNAGGGKPFSYGFGYTFARQLTPGEIMALAMDPGVLFRPAPAPPAAFVFINYGDMTMPAAGGGGGTLDLGAISNLTLAAAGAGSAAASVSTFGLVTGDAAGAGSATLAATSFASAAGAAAGAGSATMAAGAISDLTLAAVGAGSANLALGAIVDVVLPAAGAGGATLFATDSAPTAARTQLPVYGLGPTDLLATMGMGATAGLVAFSVVGASQPSPLTIRVTFSSPPRAYDPSDPADALVPASWALVGPTAATVALVAPVTGDPLSVDLFVGAPLAPGAWTISGSPSILSLDGGPLEAPRFALLRVVTYAPSGDVAGGAVEESLLRRHLNPVLEGPAWDALILAVEGDAEHEVGDRYVANLARRAFDQLFPSTASGNYLIQRAAEVGVRQPESVGLGVEAFRQLVAALSNNLLVDHAVNDVLEVFYGPDSVRATITTTALEPYRLQDRDDLTILFGERRPVTVQLHGAQFAAIGAATAVEVAAAIDRDMRAEGVHGFAAAVPDPVTGKGRVVVYADARGLPSGVRVTGGRAQVALRFPEVVLPTLSSPFGSWTITPSPDVAGRLRFSSSPVSAFDLALVRRGDRALVYGPEFPADVLGTHDVLEVSVSYPGGILDQWFEIEGSGVFVLVVQQAATSLTFLRSRLRSVHDNDAPAFFSQGEDLLRVTLPATSPVVRRGDGQAAYLAPPLQVSVLGGSRDAAGRVTLATSAFPPGLVDTTYGIMVDGVFAAASPPPTTPGTPSPALATLASGVAAASPASAASEGNSYRGVRYAMAQTGSGHVLVAGGKEVDGAGVETPVGRLTFFKVDAASTLPDGSVQLSYSWTRPATPVVAQHHEDAQATALLDPGHDGQVLLTGGHTALASAQAAATIVNFQPSPPLATAAPTGAMGTARAMHRASLLADGRVLASGGFAAWPTPLASAERWSPTSATWAAAAPMATARMDHAQVVLPDGRVLVSGGLTSASAQTAACELYDPVGNTWTPTGQMQAQRAGHALVVTPSGQVLAVGGVGRDASVPGAPAALATAELWDPVSGSWRAAGAMRAPRARPAAAYVDALGGVLAAGCDATSTEVWTPRGWRLGVASLPRVRRDAQAFLAPCPAPSLAPALAVPVAVVLPGGTELISAVWTTTEHSSIVVPGREDVVEGGLDGPFGLVSLSLGGQVVYDTPFRSPATVGAGGTVTAVGATAIAFKGAHVVDPDGVALTETRAPVGVALAGGQAHAAVSLLSTFSDPDPARRFPDAPGYLVFRYGRQGQFGPVRYLGRLSDTDLRLDAGLVFPVDVAVGDDVTLLSSRDHVVPADPLAGYLWLTASPAGRVAASAALDDVVAAGVEVEKFVEYPGDAGLGAAGAPTVGAARLSTVVASFAGDRVDEELAAARGGTDG